MLDVLRTAEAWRQSGHRFAMATVVKTWGSSPRPLGAAMAIRDDGFIAGSVSGGCVEGAVIEAALRSLETGKPELLQFDALSDAQVWQVGLSCGGSIHVWIDPHPAERDPVLWQQLVAVAGQEVAYALVTQFEPFSQNLQPTDLRKSEAVEGGFVQVFSPKDLLIIVGAVHIAIPLVAFGKSLGFRVIVIDPRSALLMPERFPTPPDEARAQWPSEALADITLGANTYAVVLSHDPKIDDAALSIFLKSPMRYIGALGSRKTQEKRHRDLAALGFSAFDIARVHGPVGLTIGAKSPEEIAISIAAEIVSIRHALD